MAQCRVRPVQRAFTVQTKQTRQLHAPPELSALVARRHARNARQCLTAQTRRPTHQQGVLMDFSRTQGGQSACLAQLATPVHLRSKQHAVEKPTLLVERQLARPSQMGTNLSTFSQLRSPATPGTIQIHQPTLYAHNVQKALSAPLRLSRFVQQMKTVRPDQPRPPSHLATNGKIALTIRLRFVPTANT